jgi:hypothetical protein
MTLFHVFLINTLHTVTTAGMHDTLNVYPHLAAAMGSLKMTLDLEQILNLPGTDPG